MSLSSAVESGGAIHLKSSDDLDGIGEDNKFFRNEPDDIATAGPFELEEFNLAVTNTENVTLNLPAVPDGTTLTSVRGFVAISNNNFLQRIAPALSHLRSVGLNCDTETCFGFRISSNPRLESLPSFEELEVVNASLNIDINGGLKSISGFNALNSLSGALDIFNNGELETVEGFNSLPSIGADPNPIQVDSGDILRIAQCEKLLSISGFDMLTSVAGFVALDSNAELQSISGFDMFQSIGGALSIQGNPSLTSIPNFPALTSVGENLEIVGSGLLDIPGFPVLEGGTSGGIFIDANDDLLDISGFGAVNLTAALIIADNDSLQSISGFGTLTTVVVELVIADNDALTSLSGFGALEFVGGTRRIEGNPSLTSLADLSSLTNVAGSCIINPPSLLTNAPDNVQAACSS